MRNLFDHILRLPGNLIVLMIRGYQQTLSPDHGPLRHLYTYGYCRHSPTCSQYAIERIYERGLVIGGLLAIKRVLGCVPWRKADPQRILEVAMKR